MNPRFENEFSRPIVLLQIGERDSRHRIAAEPEERQALVKRLELADLMCLEGEIALRRVRGGTALSVKGHLRAELAQICVATLEPLALEIEEDFAEDFALPERGDLARQREVEVWLDEELETAGPEIYAAGSFDLGEFLVQLLAERLDAFPRDPNAPSREGQWGPVEEASDSPFADLGRKLLGQ